MSNSLNTDRIWYGSKPFVKVISREQKLQLAGNEMKIAIVNKSLKVCFACLLTTIILSF